jgi:GNAT superfamily N-acetyltransferase
MRQDQISLKKPANIEIRPFGWQDWDAMWTVRRYQLAEDGVILDGPITPPDFTIVYDETNPNFHEIDLDRIDECYLKGRGNFWIAWADGQPVGYVGAQDKGDYTELRHMYVRENYRRLGIGSKLVQALIEHCQRQKAGRIKLWTAAGGPGRFLYETLGFQQVTLHGDEANHPSALDGEIRMGLDLMD